MDSFLNYVTDSGVTIRDLKEATENDIKESLRLAARNWNLEQFNQASGDLEKRKEAEKEAYAVSDTIAPLYYYQGQCFNFGH